MMIRTALVLVFAGHRLVQADTDTEIAKGLEMCGELFAEQFRRTPVIDCCEGLDVFAVNTRDEAKCAPPKPDDDWKCENSECLFKNYGVLKDDKTIDYKKVEKNYDQFAKMNPSAKPMLDLVKEECSEDNLAPISELACPAINFHTCMFIVAVSECPNWNQDKQHCKDIQEKATICKSALEKLLEKEKS